jgi:hypothetical protein
MEIPSMNATRTSSNRYASNLRWLATCLLLTALSVVLAGCGSTKVYTADKTITYNGALYNMGNVQRIASSIEGQLPDGSTRDMRGMDKKAVESLLKEQSPVTVTTAVTMDDQQMVYERKSVKKYSEYNKMAKNLDDALKGINKFMADKKKTQLKLK